MLQQSAYPALVLNADFSPISYFPLSVMPWQEAVHAVIAERVVVVEQYDAVARSPSIEFQLPSVVALRTFQPPPKRVPFTRFNVFLRDRFKCQYCTDKFPSSELTFDHVVPRSKGGLTSWENIVAACRPCNGRKDKHMHMKPIRAPKMPTPHEMLAAKRQFPPRFLHETWQDYLYWDTELEA